MHDNNESWWLYEQRQDHLEGKYKFNSQGSEVLWKDRFARDQINQLARLHNKMAIDRHTARVGSDVI